MASTAVFVSINHDEMCCEVAAAAFEHFALACHPSDYSTQVPDVLSPLNQKSRPLPKTHVVHERYRGEQHTYYIP